MNGQIPVNQWAKEWMKEWANEWIDALNKWANE